MKNVAYALAKEHPLESIEGFGTAVAGHFLEHHSHVERATVRLAEQPLERIRIEGLEHHHAFAGKSSETRTSTVRRSRTGVHVESGIDDLFLLKTDQFGLLRVPPRPLHDAPDASDRIFATMLKADWLYTCRRRAVTRLERAACDAVRQALLETFAGHQSLSVQQTLHAMGAAALDACPEIEQITLTMPNKHRILVDLKPFGLENANEVFVATDEPHGTITGTLQRA